MRLAILSALLLTAVAPRSFGETILDPSVKGQPVDSCLTINGATDCQRGMMTASAVCKEYGFRRALAYRVGKKPAQGLQLRLHVTNQEVVIKSEWMPVKHAMVYDEIECSK